MFHSISISCLRCLSLILSLFFIPSINVSLQVEVSITGVALPAVQVEMCYTLPHPCFPASPLPLSCLIPAPLPHLCLSPAPPTSAMLPLPPSSFPATVLDARRLDYQANQKVSFPILKMQGKDSWRPMTSRCTSRRGCVVVVVVVVVVVEHFTAVGVRDRGLLEAVRSVAKVEMSCGRQREALIGWGGGRGAGKMNTLWYGFVLDNFSPKRVKS